MNLEAHAQSAFRTPLDHYARYYVGLVSNGHHYIAAHYIAFYRYPRGRHLNENVPEAIYDGGCSELHFIYDVEAAQVTNLQCHGYA